MVYIAYHVAEYRCSIVYKIQNGIWGVSCCIISMLYITSKMVYIAYHVAKYICYIQDLKYYVKRIVLHALCLITWYAIYVYDIFGKKIGGTHEIYIFDK